MRRSTLILIGTALSVLFLVLAIQSVNVTSLGEELSESKKQYIALAVVSLVLHLVIKTVRWQFLLGRSEKYPIFALLPAVLLGSLGNMVIPHSGEFLRAASLARKTNTSTSSILATIAAERVFDLLAILILLAAGALALQSLPDLFLRSGMYVALVFIVAVAAIWALISNKVSALKFAERASRWLPAAWRKRLLGSAEQAIAGLASSSHRTVILPALILAILQWSMMAGCIFACILAVGISTSWSAAIFVLFLTVAGLMLPTAPGYIGTLQFCFTLGLAPFGVIATKSFAAAVVYNAVVAVFVLIAGLASATFCGLTSRDLQALRDTE